MPNLPKVFYEFVFSIAPSENITSDESIVNKIGCCKYLLYTGTLKYEHGIKTLLQAFSLIRDENLKLIICGTGPAEKEFHDLTDKRIVFLGKVSRERALSLQKNATVLINPRQNNNEFTKYSFPSKTMEYLAAGVPVIAYKLDGIPKEYDKYIMYVPDNTPEALAETITNLLSRSDEERRSVGELNKRFVLTEKNRLVQSRRILTFLEKE